MKRPPWLLLIALACLPSSIRGRLSADDGPASRPVVFERDVRPILKAHCFQCHGEAGKQEGDLDVRLQRFLLKGGKTSAAIVPGKPDESYLLQRVRDGEMPPGDKALTDRDVATIEQWIALGAKTARPEPESIGNGPFLTYEERQFWSFQPVRRPSVPVVPRAQSVRTAVDLFLLRRLDEFDLTFSPAADRRTLIRRATFDLTGLPPRPDEVEAFLNDTSPDAYARLIDRLLASPRYGERWGRHWLDVAGYADSEGYTDVDSARSSAFRYRDYVIRSMNAGKPLDVFICEQLAGDEMVPPPHRNLTARQIDQLTATGFLRMAPDGTGSNVDQDVARNEVVADTLKIVSTSLLGLTVGCARCHDHRYDPISHLDYHRLRAVFEPALDWKQWKPPAARRISLYTDADRRRAAEIEAEAAKVDEQRKAKTEFYISRTLEEELETLPSADRDALRTAYRTAAGQRTAEQKQLLKDHPSVANISAGSLYLYDRRRDARARELDKKRQAEEKRLVEAVRMAALDALDEKNRERLLAARSRPADQRTVEQTALLKLHPAVSVTVATLSQFDPEGAARLELDRKTSQRLRAEKAADNLKKYTEQAAKIRQRIPPEGFLRALVEPPGHQPKTRLFYRGDHRQPKQDVIPGELAVLSAPETRIPIDDSALPTTGRRLAYAKHLTNGRHPLVARVIVNRVWARHFGRGLVATVGDFGALGERPSHPELLDWLADELMRSGWQLKRLHRLIMTSAAYRQVSTRTEKLERLDPDNRLLGRANIRRLEAEAVRDAVLTVSGQLQATMFGPPVPVMEDEVGQIVIGQENLDGERKPTGTIALHGAQFRRSLYIQVRRSRPLAVLETFDTPAMTPNCTQRDASNVAPQALLLMNSQFAVEHSQQLAARIRAEAGPDRRRQIRRAWLLAYGVSPSDQQTTRAIQFLARQTELFVAGDDQAGRPAKLPPDQAAQQALATYCQALLGANRFLYVD